MKLDYPDHTPYGICECDACEKNQLRQRVAHLEKHFDLDVLAVADENERLRQRVAELEADVVRKDRTLRQQAEAITSTINKHHESMQSKERELAEAQAKIVELEKDAARWLFFSEYMLSDRTDLDDEFVACMTNLCMNALVDREINKVLTESNESKEMK